MGLRIKERHLEPRRQISASERLVALEKESLAWFEAKGQPREHAEFMRHVRKAYDRLEGEATPDAMAARVRGQILASHNDSANSHNQVDIATLLSLL